MNRKQIEAYNFWCRAMNALGIAGYDQDALRRIEMTLHRWHEAECNGDIQRDDVTGKPYQHSPFDGRKMYGINDRESGALKRLAKIMERYPHLGHYVQSDPRGGALYVYSNAYKQERYPDTNIDACYSSVGVYCNYK